MVLKVALPYWAVSANRQLCGKCSKDSVDAVACCGQGIFRGRKREVMGRTLLPLAYIPSFSDHVNPLSQIYPLSQNTPSVFFSYYIHLQNVWHKWEETHR